MLTLDQAKQLILESYERQELSLYENIFGAAPVSPTEYVISRTVTKRYGWVFVVDDRRFIETGNHRYMMIGGSGCVVDRKDGSIHPLGGIYGLETWIKIYELRRWPSWWHYAIANIYLYINAVMISQVGRYRLRNPTKFYRLGIKHPLSISSNEKTTNDHSYWERYKKLKDD